MASIINNQANISYQYNQTNANVSSNIVETTVLDLYGITATKIALQNTYRLNENITYITRIENNGSDDLYNLILQDDLAQNHLTPIETSVTLIKNNETIQLVPSHPFILNIPGTLSPEEVIYIIYVAKVNNNLASDITTLTNTQTITARGGGVTRPLVSVTPNPQATITKVNYADLTIIKSTDKETIMSGDNLTYTFHIENSGNITAENVILTDYLPAGFTITSITSETNNITTTYNPNEYTFDTPTRLLTLPNTVGTPIQVPPSMNSINGKTVVKITGTVTI